MRITTNLGKVCSAISITSEIRTIEMRIRSIERSEFEDFAQCAQFRKQETVRVEESPRLIAIDEVISSSESVDLQCRP